MENSEEKATDGDTEQTAEQNEQKATDADTKETAEQNEQKGTDGDTEKTAEQNEEKPPEVPPADVPKSEEPERKESTATVPKEVSKKSIQSAQTTQEGSKKSILSDKSKPTENQTDERKPDEPEKPEEQTSEPKKPSITLSKEGTHEESKRTSISEKEQEKGRESVQSQEKVKAGLTKSYAKSAESLERKGKSPSTIKDDAIARKSRSERLSSKARNVLGSIISIRRLSTTGEFYDKTKGARYMNTYKLDSDNPFNPDKVQKILENVMIEALENLTYDADKCPKQAKWASSAIRAKVKEMQFDRYKLLCLVTIGEKNSQDVLVTCRFLWDADRDRYATYCIENTYVFGIAQCFGIYYE